MKLTRTHIVAPFKSHDYGHSLLIGLEAMVHDFSLVTALPAHAYCANSEGQSSIGAHVRHVLEFLQVLADNISSGVIDYECRAHNATYETDSHAVATMLPRVQQQLADALAVRGASHPLLLRETVAVGSEKITITTSLGRELLFMVQHGVHHLAVIKMQAAAMNIVMDSACGVAAATMIYRERLHG